MAIIPDGTLSWVALASSSSTVFRAPMTRGSASTDDGDTSVGSGKDGHVGNTLGLLPTAVPSAAAVVAHKDSQQSVAVERRMVMMVVSAGGLVGRSEQATRSFDQKELGVLFTTTRPINNKTHPLVLGPRARW